MSNTRVITALVAFIATFIFSAGLVRIIFPAPAVEYNYIRQERVGVYSQDIEEFIRQDELNGNSRDYASDYPDSVLNYWKMSSSMDASQFPQDFQNAWRIHMRAWGDYAEFLQARKAGRSGSYCQERRLNAEINRSWEDVLRVGRSYGANVY